MIAIQNINAEEMSSAKPTVQDLANFRIFLRHHVYDINTVDSLANQVEQYCEGDVLCSGFTIYATMPCDDYNTIVKPTVYAEIFRIFRSIMVTEYSQEILYAINTSKLSENRKKIYKNIMYELSTTGKYADLLLDVAITGNDIAIQL